MARAVLTCAAVTCAALFGVALPQGCLFADLELAPLATSSGGGMGGGGNAGDGGAGGGQAGGHGGTGGMAGAGQAGGNGGTGGSGLSGTGGDCSSTSCCRAIEDDDVQDPTFCAASEGRTYEEVLDCACKNCDHQPPDGCGTSCDKPWDWAEVSDNCLACIVRSCGCELSSCGFGSRCDAAASGGGDCP